MSKDTEQSVAGPEAVKSPGRPFVEFADITKRFGSNTALSEVSVTGAYGSVHAVTGENGAGKSTLMNLLAGVHRPDGGTLHLQGEAVTLGSPQDARRHGISTIFQELTLLPNLTVAENMFLGREPRRFGLVDRRAMRRAAQTALDRLDSQISPDTYCEALSVGEQQMVEIAKGIAADAEVFILDEPTAALNGPEVEKLARLIGQLKDQGKLIFYISHRLDEIFQFCDVVSVLKDGRHVATHPTSELDHQRLVSLMVGREVGTLYPGRPQPSANATPRMKVDALTPAAFGREVSFQLFAGEILGLAGLEGQGQRSIIRALAGIEPPSRGSVHKVDPQSDALTVLPPSIVATARAGVGFIPEDRKTEGLYLPLSIRQNVGLGMLRDQGIWHRARVSGSQIEQLLAKMRVVSVGSGQAVGALSGGNQQKVMIGRWLASGVDVLLIEEPTRGVDVGAKAEIYKLLREFADAGGAVLITSSELTEVLGLCDRILTVRGGALVAEFMGAEATEELVMHAALTGTIEQEAVA
ncbi:sugar ABC transporter ATP-binding protein [Pseudooceanicola sp. MF1-13]|uniref:sugar ABC transporter ATP-binding protein n=1 Tax=Pseudooceanicola sp. MF1-13 TaxID=3379095 RepID=UPI003892C7AB